jgi:hypothetical protein
MRTFLGNQKQPKKKKKKKSKEDAATLLSKKSQKITLTIFYFPHIFPATKHSIKKKNTKKRKKKMSVLV